MLTNFSVSQPERYSNCLTTIRTRKRQCTIDTKTHSIRLITTRINDDSPRGCYYSHRTTWVSSTVYLLILRGSMKSLCTFVILRSSHSMCIRETKVTQSASDFPHLIGFVSAGFVETISANVRDRPQDRRRGVARRLTLQIRRHSTDIA